MIAYERHRLPIFRGVGPGLRVALSQCSELLVVSTTYRAQQKMRLDSTGWLNENLRTVHSPLDLHVQHEFPTATFGRRQSR